MDQLPDQVTESHFKEFKKYFPTLVTSIQEANLPAELSDTAAIFHDIHLRLESNTGFDEDDIMYLLKGCEEMVRLQRFTSIYEPMKRMLTKLVWYVSGIKEYHKLSPHIRRLATLFDAAENISPVVQ